MARLFEPVNIGTLTLKNRSVRSATWTGMAHEDGRCSSNLIALMKNLARGEIGLLITGFAYVMPNGQALANQLGIHNDDMIPSFFELTRAVHDVGGKIAMQIAHAGVQTTVRSTANQSVWAPSAVHSNTFKKTPKALTQREIKSVVRAFADAAQRAKRAGFDAVQLHAAHGYLVSRFLSPSTNIRTDVYGGPIENRARFLFQIYRAVRKAVGKDFPVLVKLNGKDFLPRGLTVRDALFVSKELDRMGIDAIEISGGTPASGSLGPARPHIDAGDKEAYFMPLAKKINKEISTPVILVGGIRSLETVETVFDSETASLVSFSRPLIREPHLIKRWKTGDKRKAECISCNLCFRAARGRDGVYCMASKRSKKRISA